MPRALLLTTALGLLLAGCAGRPDCSATGGFERGRAGEAAASRCDSTGYQDAWRLGRTLGELEREQDALGAHPDRLTPAERQRLRVLSREIPELETLARLQGLLPAPDTRELIDH